MSPFERIWRRGSRECRIYILGRPASRGLGYRENTRLLQRALTAVGLEPYGRPGRIVFRHLLPGFTSHIIVSLSLSVPMMILGETALSFLGLGLRAPVVSWGVMFRVGDLPAHGKGICSNLLQI